MSSPILGVSFYIPDEYSRARQPLITEITRIKEVMNKKTTGDFFLFENNTSQNLFGGARNNAAIFRTVVDFGSLPNAGSKSVAHGVNFNSNFRFVKIQGSATDSSALEAIPLPYSSTTLNENIEMLVNATNVVIETGIDYSDFDAIIVLEYAKI